MRTLIDPELLISLIEKKPTIWDKTLRSYKDKDLRAAAWREICISMKEDFKRLQEVERQMYVKNVVKKWNQIRESWCRSLNANNTKKYCYHNQMLFLKKIVKTPESYDSENNTETNQDNENGERENSNQHEEVEFVPSAANESPGQENSTSSASHKQENTTNTSHRQEKTISSASRSQENTPSSASRRREYPTNAKRFKKREVPRHVIDNQNMSYLHQIKPQSYAQNEDRNMYFFKSLLPSLASFNDDQTLQFQAGVISLLQEIRSRNRNQGFEPPSNYSYQSQQYFIPQCIQSSPSPTSIHSSSQIDHFQPSPAQSTFSDFAEVDVQEKHRFKVELN